MGIFKEASSLLKNNIRQYGMFIALGVIIITFQIATNGLFLSPDNVSNLIQQTGYIAVLAVGMTLVIIIRHIDLSVGWASGFCGAIAAILMVQHDVSAGVTILIVLLMGLIIGLFNGFMVAYAGIPAFVVTLAGMFIFRGLLNLSLVETGSIIITDETFLAIGNGFIPTMGETSGGLIISTLLVGALAIIFLVVTDIRKRKQQIAYGFEHLSLPMMVIKLVFISSIIVYVTYLLASSKGISWTLVIMVLIVAIYHFITQKTALGRHIYAVGGNPEAAELSGISVKRITMIVFASMGTLTALSGMMFASRMSSATPTAGNMFELDAIAAAYVGGVSAAGGVGKVTGTVVGAFVMSSLTNGMNLMSIDISMQYVVKGLVLLLAVAFDVWTRNKGK